MSGEKTEKPTPKKQQDARKKGQVGQSQDVHKLALVVALLEVTLAMVESSMTSLEEMVATPLSMLEQPFGYAVGAVFIRCITIGGSLMIITLGLAFIVRLFATWFQIGFLFAPEALKLDFNRLNPLNTLKQMFSSKKLFELGSGIAKAAVIVVLMYFLLKQELQTLINLVLTDLETGWRQTASAFARIERVTLMVLLVLAVTDFCLQKYFHTKQLKMSMQDIKEEYKQMEGDPHTKGQRRQLAMELATSDAPPPPPKLDEADALIVNPTHFAVALYYRPEETPLPKIVCKGQDDEALSLIEQAKEKNIPVIRFIWLARTLYPLEQGEYIPRETLKYVAKIYQVLQQLDEEYVHEELLHIPNLENPDQGNG